MELVSYLIGWTYLKPLACMHSTFRFFNYLIITRYNLQLFIDVIAHEARLFDDATIGSNIIGEGKIRFRRFRRTAQQNRRRIFRAEVRIGAGQNLIGKGQSRRRKKMN